MLLLTFGAAILAAVVSVGGSISWTDPCESGEATQFPGNHDTWQAVLSEHVCAGTKSGITTNLVNYTALRSDPSMLRAYLGQLCNADPTSMSDAELLAFWLNAYNAAMMTMVVVNEPLGDNVLAISAVVSITVWDHPIITVAGEKLTPGEIEHNRIRQNASGSASDGAAARNGAQGRVHSAMNCAALSCPSLSVRAFEAADVSEHLTHATGVWLRDRTKNLSPAGGNVSLSMIFNWFAGDFAAESGSVRQFLREFAPDVYGDVPANGLTEYLFYDWTVNGQKGASDVSCDSGADIAPWLSTPAPNGSTPDSTTPAQPGSNTEAPDNENSPTTSNTGGGGGSGGSGGIGWPTPSPTTPETISSASAMCDMAFAIPWWILLLRLALPVGC